MPYPTPLLTDLNLLFENHSPRKPLTSQDNGTQHIASDLSQRDGSLASASYSPASSTSTLALEDDEIQSIFASVKFLDEEPVPPTTPREELNPLAAPFIPAFQPQSLTKNPVQRVAPPPPAQPQLPIWFDAFARGSCTSATPDHKSYALVIVTSRPWPIEAMAELAQHFCCRGAEKVTEESAGIAPFAFMVYRQFFDVHGEDTAQSFIWHLRECVVGSFKACWDPESPQGITYYNAPSFNYVASAIAQAAFIGQLFTLDLIPGPHTATCIVTLLKGLNSYEHLEALRAIIANAKASFWHGPDAPGQGNIAIHKFVATFLEAVAPLSGNMSVLGRSLKAGEMQGIIAEVENMVTGWVYEPARPPFEVDMSKWPKPMPLSIDTPRLSSSDLRKKLFDPKRARK
ncbi:hypothetical protein B0H10DRAFT_1945433 [Mycena sp. CBHHK59/15]|nr:hypothetical protein B0H10DRAFT_1945433 [Mycena sp. CBHHK59/15]